jgi:hypothetical protein
MKGLDPMSQVKPIHVVDWLLRGLGGCLKLLERAIDDMDEVPHQAVQDLAELDRRLGDLRRLVERSKRERR